MKKRALLTVILMLLFLASAGVVSAQIGDGGPATSATLSTPVDVAFDSSDNLFIADQSNSRIRKVDTSGIITTAAGDGAQGFNGDNIPATSASLHSPRGVDLSDARIGLISDE